MPALSSFLLIILLISPTDACMRVTPGNPGIPATCQQCNQALITKTTTGAGAHDFATDTTAIVNGCSARTLTCTGTQAGIEINPPNGDGIIDDGGTGTATVTVTCNSAGTAWVFMGVTVTTLECSSVPAAGACTTCDQALITKTVAGAGAQAFASDTTATVNGCSVRTLVCTGQNANVEFNNGDGIISDTDPGQVAGTVTIMVTCSADGTGWMLDNVVITQMECAAA